MTFSVKAKDRICSLPKKKKYLNDSFDYLYCGYLILQLRHGKWDESVHWVTGHKLVIFYKEKHKVLNHYITKGKNIFKTLCKLGVSIRVSMSR